MKLLKNKILHCLENIPKTRDSDTLLTNTVWFLFYKEMLFQREDGKWCVELTNIHVLPTEDNVKRIRAHYQNKKHLYLPTNWEVAKKRKWKEEDWRSLLGLNPELRTL